MLESAVVPRTDQSLPSLRSARFHLVSESVAEILRKGLCPMLEEEKVGDLARMHRLFRRIDAEKSLVKAIGVCVFIRHIMSPRPGGASTR